MLFEAAARQIASSQPAKPHTARPTHAQPSEGITLFAQAKVADLAALSSKLESSALLAERFPKPWRNLGSSQQGCCPAKLVFDSSLDLSHLVRVALQDLQVSLIDLTLSSFFSSSNVLGGLFHVVSLVLQEGTELLGLLLEGRVLSGLQASSNSCDLAHVLLHCT